jgi:hypothetical protein
MDPTGLQRLPTSEFRKRRAYWLAYVDKTSPKTNGGVTVEQGWEPEEGATIIGEE